MFARKINVFILRTGIVGLLNLVSIYFTGHYLGPEPLGLIGYASSFIQMFFMFSELGFGQAHIKRISEGKDIDSCVGTYIYIKVTILIILTAALLTYLWIKKNILHSYFNEPEVGRIIYLLIIPMILAQLSTIPLNTFEARKEAIKVSLPLIVSPLLKLPFIIIVAVMGLGVYGLVFTRYIGGLSLLILALILMKQKIKKPDLSYVKTYFSYAYKVFILTILVQFSVQLDKLMIGRFISSEAVGLYVAALSIITVLKVIPNAVGSLLFPTISNKNAEKDMDAVRDYTHKSEKYIAMALIPISFSIAFFSKEIITIILGPKFLSATAVLSLMSFYLLINGLRKPSASLLAGIEKVGLLTRASTISIIINILLNIVLIPAELFGFKLFGLGINGAAIATVCSGLVFSLLCRIEAYRTTRIRTYRGIYVQYAAGVIMVLLFWILTSIFHISEYSIPVMVLSLCLFCIVGFSLFMAVLALFKELTISDIKMVVDSVNPKKMKQYFKSEILDDARNK